MKNNHQKDERPGRWQDESRVPEQTERAKDVPQSQNLPHQDNPEHMESPDSMANPQSMTDVGHQVGEDTGAMDDGERKSNETNRTSENSRRGS